MGPVESSSAKRFLHLQMQALSFPQAPLHIFSAESPQQRYLMQLPPAVVTVLVLPVAPVELLAATLVASVDASKLLIAALVAPVEAAISRTTCRRVGACHESTTICGATGSTTGGNTSSSHYGTVVSRIKLALVDASFIFGASTNALLGCKIFTGNSLHQEKKAECSDEELHDD